MIFPLDKIVIDCGRGECSQVPWQDPTTYVPQPFWQSIWMLIIGAIIVAIFITAIAIVRFQAHEERGQTERDRIRNPPKQCPTCGDKI